MGEGLLPDSIERGDWTCPSSLRGLASDEVLTEVVGKFTGFPHQSLVLHISTRYLLIDVLKAHEEGPMAKAKIKSERETSLGYITERHIERENKKGKRVTTIIC